MEVRGQNGIVGVEVDLVIQRGQVLIQVGLRPMLLSLEDELKYVQGGAHAIIAHERLSFQPKHNRISLGLIHLFQAPVQQQNLLNSLTCLSAIDGLI